MSCASVESAPGGVCLPAGEEMGAESVASVWLRHAVGSTVCVTVTELDGLVAARSAFNHSMNYRSAVVIGRARLVEDEAERARALDLVVDQMVPGRAMLSVGYPRACTNSATARYSSNRVNDS